MSPSTLIWNSPLPAEWPVRADSLKVKNYTKNTQQIIFFISRKINTNYFGPKLFWTKAFPGPKKLKPSVPGGLRIFRAFASLFFCCCCCKNWHCCPLKLRLLGQADYFFLCVKIDFPVDYCQKSLPLWICCSVLNYGGPLATSEKYGETTTFANSLLWNLYIIIISDIFMSIAWLLISNIFKEGHAKS